MDSSPKHQIVRLIKGHSETVTRQVVAEYPLRLRVNGRELATLICSPHQLNFLVAGFLHLQGFIDCLDDIQSLGICDDFGLGEVRLGNALPDKLQLTLTSGCGAGISYNLPQQVMKDSCKGQSRYTSNSLFLLMRQLKLKSKRYRQHGGIHSAAIGDREGLLFHAEDIGRHNTLDRLAGEALFKGVDLHGKILYTSGRISTEMVAKAVRLGIGLLASRSSPTNRAIELCKQAGITLVGYLRGESLEVYSHPQHLQLSACSQQISGISGVILAGGESQRMGSDKSLLPLQGARFIDHIYARLRPLFEEVIIVTNSPELYHDLPCRKVPDIYLKQGALAGIHAGLSQVQQPRAFVVGCDMPFISEKVVRKICSHAKQGDLILPLSSCGHEPLHALYAKNCLPAMEQVLEAGHKRIMKFFSQVRVVEISAAELLSLDPQEKSFCNVNTPDEYFRLRGLPFGDEHHTDIIKEKQV